MVRVFNCVCVCVCAGLDIEHLMQCVHKGQIAVASSGLSEVKERQITPPLRRHDVAVIGSILKGEVVLDQQAMGLLASHLHSCSTEEEEPAQLTATLQAVRILIQEKQVKVIAGCGVTFWLIDLIEDLVQMKGEKMPSFADVMELLTQATSLLLVSLSTGLVTV